MPKVKTFALGWSPDIELERVEIDEGQIDRDAISKLGVIVGP
ncbi:hypothetical protein L861_14490 [Litchfieldella anticariensis FP35 = DSM 16096]|uniref:Uncharacterized protein n=1 Tax=Litchfieldella anticariensis (strain DSM 16096 / CECT 5854 / CIP 108499 / LMG 22089 / FP35) TaxID=1121939 RepID=S2KXJ0_LITA3|nr:hypothetical protein [Halomonas anticariensis]EPC00134.1 hypothetical protein L861_14490 [Halomonas anticariensis FP35 = DSM 16096]